MSNVLPAFSGELMLANWRETSSGGATVTFWLADANDLDVFRSMTVRKGNMAGQRFMAVLVEIGDDERPTRPALSQQAFLLCRSLGFQQFAEHKLNFAHENPAAREQMAADFMRSFCRIQSRSELDTDGRAGMAYQQLLAEFRLFNINL